MADVRHRPRSSARHYAGLLAPSASTATKLAFERNGGQRTLRLAAAAADRIGQRVRRPRPRMRVLTAAPGGRLRWRSAPAPPPPGAQGAVVHPIAIATCDMDPLIALGATPFPLPLHLGHECVAEVLSVGERVTTVRPGQRVVVPFQISCGSCAACRDGRTGNCSAVPPISMYGFGLAGGHWGGAYSDELAVPFADAMLVPLPEDLDPVAAASVADTVCDGYRHVAPFLPALLEGDASEPVLIVSAVTPRSRFSASCSLYAGLAARALGARRVLLADCRPHVRALAEQLGLEALHPRELRGPQARLVADISGTPAGLKLALQSTGADGLCSCAGGLHGSARIPLLELYGRNVTLRVSRSHVRTLIPDVLELMQQGRLRPERVTTVTGPLDQAPQLLREHYTGGGVKTILA